MEPSQLYQGKIFHQKVQDVWGGTIEGMVVCSEFNIRLGISTSLSLQHKSGRIDIFVDRIEDFVFIVEIKATDWDKIKKQNLVKNMGSHRRQIFKYIDKFLYINKVNVCATIIYPKPPLNIDLKEFIENYFTENGLAIIWYNES